MLMAVNALLFAVIFLLVATNYRLAADDFHHLVKTKELGIWGAMKFYYDHWNPRWSSILVTNTFLVHGTDKWMLFCFHLTSLLFGSVAFASASTAIGKVLQLPLKNWMYWLFGIYLLCTTFYISFSHNDTWFWITVNPMYLWGTLAAVLGVSLIFQNWNATLRRLLTVVLFLYVGGASESAAISTLIALIYIGFRLHKRPSLLFDSKALHLATIACMIGFGISMLGPGISIRREHLPHFPVHERILVGLWNYVRFDLKEIPMVLPLAILFVSPFGFLGRKHLRFQLISIRDVFWQNRALWILADLMIFLIAMALGLVMSEMGPTRAWFPLTILVVIVAVALAYQLGTWLYVHSKGHLFHLAIAAQIIALVYQALVGFHEIRITNEYAAAVDKRMEHISSLTETDTVIELPPLPDSGWLLSAEISPDTSHFTNRHLGLFFQNGNKFFVADSLTSSP
ncbi:MAG: hypothetical protein RL266_420 [Bacteroidota bacterium]